MGSDSLAQELEDGFAKVSVAENGEVGAQEKETRDGSSLKRFLAEGRFRTEG